MQRTAEVLLDPHGVTHHPQCPRANKTNASARECTLEELRTAALHDACLNDLRDLVVPSGPLDIEASFFWYESLLSRLADTSTPMAQHLIASSRALIASRAVLEGAMSHPASPALSRWGQDLHAGAESFLAALTGLTLDQRAEVLAETARKFTRASAVTLRSSADAPLRWVLSSPIEYCPVPSVDVAYLLDGAHDASMLLPEWVLEEARTWGVIVPPATPVRPDETAHVLETARALMRSGASAQDALDSARVLEA